MLKQRRGKEKKIMSKSTNEQIVNAWATVEQQRTTEVHSLPMARTSTRTV